MDAQSNLKSHMTIADDALVGLLVGALDVALLWPFVVIACRREAGSPSVAHAVKQGKPWAGGTAALTMLVPYCVLVETLGNLTARHERSNEENAWTSKLLKTPLTSLVIALGLQPIEKKLVMDSLFQTQRTGHGPIADVIAYARQSGGLRRLLTAGFFPLWARETIYVSAVTVLNPMMTTDNANASTTQKCLSAFGIGFFAGMISAPLQTLNVLQKDERNFGKSLRSLLFKSEGNSASLVQRLYFGSGSRSFRTGAAGVLWYLSRANVAALHHDGES